MEFTSPNSAALAFFAQVAGSKVTEFWCTIRPLFRDFLDSLVAGLTLFNPNVLKLGSTTPLDIAAKLDHSVSMDAQRIMAETEGASVRIDPDGYTLQNFDFPQIVGAGQLS